MRQLNAISVGDADNFRLYHTPGVGWSWPLKLRKVPKTTKGMYLLEALPSRPEGDYLPWSRTCFTDYTHSHGRS